MKEKKWLEKEKSKQKEGKERNVLCNEGEEVVKEEEQIDRRKRKKAAL